MKRIILFLLVSLNVTILFSQVRLGLKGGVNISHVNLSNIDFSKSNRTGFFVGPIVEATIPIIGLGVDGAVLYSQRKTKIEGKQVNRNSIEVPVNLKYNIGFRKLFGIYFAAGPSFYFDLNERYKSFEDFTVKNKKVQVGLNLGAGVNLINHLQIGANYNLPLGDTAEIISDQLEGSCKLNTWQVSLAYFF